MAVDYHPTALDVYKLMCSLICMGILEATQTPIRSLGLMFFHIPQTVMLCYVRMLNNSRRTKIKSSAKSCEHQNMNIKFALS